MTLTAAEHRALAEKADRDALTAPTPLLSRAYRLQAREHRLDALMSEYRLTVTL